MTYRIGSLPLNDLISPLCEATEALARLDETVGHSPLKAGWIARMHFHDAVASAALTGELVHLEELILHDSAQDVRTPTTELTRAHSILRTRRRIASQPADWALSGEGLGALIARDLATRSGPHSPADAPPDDAVDQQIEAIDAVIARSTKVIEDISLEVKSALGRGSVEPRRMTVSEREKLDNWLGLIERTVGLPTLMRAALLYDAWSVGDILPHAPWTGSLLVAAFLRQEGMALHHLPLVDYGARLVSRQQRKADSRDRRLLAIFSGIRLGALSARKEHDRLDASRAQLLRRFARRRISGRVEAFIDLVMRTPAISTGMAQSAVGLSKQGALNLIADAGLREITGRNRYRMWSVP